MKLTLLYVARERRGRNGERDRAYLVVSVVKHVSSGLLLLLRDAPHLIDESQMA